MSGKQVRSDGGSKVVGLATSRNIMQHHVTSGAGQEWKVEAEAEVERVLPLEDH